MKLHFYITNVDEYLKGDFGNSITCSSWGNWEDENYMHAGEHEVNINIDADAVTQKAVSMLDAAITKERGEHTVKMDMLQGRINELLAIEHKS